MGQERSAMKGFIDKEKIDKDLAIKKILGDNIFCNKCGEQIAGDYLSVNKEWGYFSDKDTEIHRFAMCEKCYDEMIKTFATPPIQELKKEVM